MDRLIDNISQDGKSKFTLATAMKVILQALQSMLQQLRPVTFMLMVFCVQTTVVSAGEWVLKEEWRGGNMSLCADMNIGSKVTLNVPDEDTGIVTGQGQRWHKGCGFNDTTQWNVIEGKRDGDTIHLKLAGPQFINVWDMVIPLEDGWEKSEPVSQGKGLTITHRLSGQKIENWQLTYNGYEVKRFGLSNYWRKDNTVDQLTGGLKVYWTNTVDFKVRKTKKGRKYLSGQGSARVTHTEPFSMPAGVYNCSADENPIPVHKGTFSVNGSISKSKLKLHLPENDFHLTIDCLLDSDALEKHLRGLAGEAILRDRFSGMILPHGTQTMNLVEHSETIHDYQEYGLKRTLRKLSED